PEGPRPEDADARGVPRAARGGAGARLEVRALRQGQAPCRRARGCRGRPRSREVPQGRGGRTSQAPGPRGPQARRGESARKKERTEKGARENGGRRARSGARTEVALELSSRGEELVDRRETLRLIEERGVTAVGRGERPQLRLLALHALEGRDAQDVGGGAADGEDRCPEALPQRPQIRCHGLPVLQ